MPPLPAELQVRCQHPPQHEDAWGIRRSDGVGDLRATPLLPINPEPTAARSPAALLVGTLLGGKEVGEAESGSWRRGCGAPASPPGPQLFLAPVPAGNCCPAGREMPPWASPVLCSVLLSPAGCGTAQRHAWPHGGSVGPESRHRPWGGPVGAHRLHPWAAGSPTLRAGRLFPHPCDRSSFKCRTLPPCPRFPRPRNSLPKSRRTAQ